MSNTVLSAFAANNRCIEPEVYWPSQYFITLIKNNQFMDFKQFTNLKVFLFIAIFLLFDLAFATKKEVFFSQSLGSWEQSFKAAEFYQAWVCRLDGLEQVHHCCYQQMVHLVFYYFQQVFKPIRRSSLSMISAFIFFGDLKKSQYAKAYRLQAGVICYRDILWDDQIKENNFSFSSSQMQINVKKNQILSEKQQSTDFNFFLKTRFKTLIASLFQFQVHLKADSSSKIKGPKHSFGALQTVVDQSKVNEQEQRERVNKIEVVTVKGGLSQKKTKSAELDKQKNAITHQINIEIGQTAQLAVTYLQAAQLVIGVGQALVALAGYAAIFQRAPLCQPLLMTIQIDQQIQQLLKCPPKWSLHLYVPPAPSLKSIQIQPQTRAENRLANLMSQYRAFRNKNNQLSLFQSKSPLNHDILRLNKVRLLEIRQPDPQKAILPPRAINKKMCTMFANKISKIVAGLKQINLDFKDLIEKKLYDRKTPYSLPKSKLFFQAVKSSDHSSVQNLLFAEPLLAHTVDNMGRTGLMWSIKRGHNKITQILLPLTFKNYGDELGNTAIHYAIFLQDKKLLQRMQNCSVNPLLKNKNGENCLTLLGQHIMMAKEVMGIVRSYFRKMMRPQVQRLATESQS